MRGVTSTAISLAYLMTTHEPIPGFRLAIQVGAMLAYLAPSIIAQRYRHPRQDIIIVFKVALGWTIVGWVIVPVWSLKGACWKIERSAARPPLFFRGFACLSRDKGWDHRAESWRTSQPEQRNDRR